MKKIVLISASVLALGAASIAADADGLHYTTAMSLTSASVFGAGQSRAIRGDRLVIQPIERKVRLVSSNVKPVTSCDAAYWPYYPAACLERAQTTDL